MKKHTFVVVVLAILAGPTSCNLLPSSLEKTWHITKIELAALDEESESIYTNAFLSFCQNGAVSFFNKNEQGDNRPGSLPLFRMGQWRKNANELKIELKHTMISVTFKILELSEKWLVLEITGGPKETVGTVLKCQGSELYKSRSFDLLDPQNNAWRAKAEHKENREEIKARVAGHVDFLIAYFRMLEEKSQPYFETSILQTPFQFYSNGMSLPSQFESDAVWLSNFYDEADAALGAKMLVQGLTSIDVYPSDERSYTKGYCNALLLIKEHIEK